MRNDMPMCRDSAILPLPSLPLSFNYSRGCRTQGIPTTRCSHHTPFEVGKDRKWGWQDKQKVRRIDGRGGGRSVGFLSVPFLSAAPPKLCAERIGTTREATGNTIRADTRREPTPTAPAVNLLTSSFPVTSWRLCDGRALRITPLLSGILMFDQKQCGSMTPRQRKGQGNEGVVQAP